MPTVRLGRGRFNAPPKDLGIGEVRPLTREDLEELKKPREKVFVKTLRDSHHNIARLIAIGLTSIEAAEQSGYSKARVNTLMLDPAFQELVAQKRKLLDAGMASAEAERAAAAQRLNLKALRHLEDHFDKADEEGELIPIAKALDVFKDTSDRVGIPKKNLNVNVNVDYAAQLEAAHARIRAQLNPTPPMKVINPPSTAPDTVAPATIRRRV